MTIVIPGKLYRHFKGGLYRVVDVATHTESGETLVIYRAEGEGAAQLWARPHWMFVARVGVGPEAVPRFALEDDDD
jgi:hypothetical protein